MRLFWAKTYEGTSLSDLTSEMGINAPSLYAAFGSKQALFDEAIAHYSANYHHGIWTGLVETPSIFDAVTVFLKRSAEAFSIPDQPRGCMIVLGAQHSCSGDNAVQEGLREIRKANLETVRARFERAKAERELDQEFDTQGAATMLLSMQAGMTILARDGAGREELMAAADTYAQALRALAGRD